MDDEEKSDEPAELTRKHEYAPVFSVPAEPWRIGALWEEAYFDSATYVIEVGLIRSCGHVLSVPNALDVCPD
jgi:hypothetical protein